MNTIEVVNHWVNDSGDVEIVLLKSLDPHRELQNDLFWYSDTNRPGWEAGTQLTDKDVMLTKCYRQRKFQSIEADIPNDCYMPIF